MCCYGEEIFDSITGSLVAIIIYRPPLALFLNVRLCLDGMVSKAFEVRNHECKNMPCISDVKSVLDFARIHLGSFQPVEASIATRART